MPIDHSPRASSTAGVRLHKGYNHGKGEAMRYYTNDGHDITESIKARPYEIQIREYGKWGTIPGAYYASRREALRVARKRAGNSLYRVVDRRLA